jgi:hypothetical protein
LGRGLFTKQEEGKMAKVSGTTLLNRLLYIDKRGAPGQKRQILEKLSPENKKEIKRGVQAHKWYAFEWYIELITAIDNVMGRGDMSLVRDIGYFAGMQAGAGLYKFFFKTGSVRFILERAASFWKQMFDTGECETVVLSDHHGKVYVRNFPRFPKAACLSLEGWCQAVAELAGGKEVKMKIVKWPQEDDPTLEMDAAWQ